MSSSSSWTLTARWIFPVTSPPVHHGRILIRGSRIEKVLSSKDGPLPKADVDLGDVAVLPGFVNAHTHLDLSGRQRLPADGEFTDWLRSVIRQRREEFHSGIQGSLSPSAIRKGIEQCLTYGVTLVGDISAGGLSWEQLANAPLRAVVFYELLGLPEHRALEALGTARHWLENHRATETCRPGLSPHAPYSVRDTLFTQASLLAQKARVPLATHWAETTAELELLSQHTGPFVGFLQELGVWDPSGLAANVEQVPSLCAAAPLQLYIHANYWRSMMQAQLSQQSTLVYCPRTHAYFRHPPHPFLSSAQQSIRFALGTDSLASNPDLDILAEARFVKKLAPDLPGEYLLRAITLNGAEALGWESEVGSLESGKSADLVVLPLYSSVDPPPSSAYDLIFRSEQPVNRVLFRGAWRQSPS